MDIFNSSSKFFSRQTIVSICVMLAMAAICLVFSQHVKATIEEQNVNYLVDGANEAERHISLLFLSSRQNIQIIAHLYSERMAGPEVDFDKLKEIEGSSSFNNIRFVDRGGVCHSTGGATVEVSDREYFKKAMRGENGVAAITSRFTGETVFIVYAPLYYEGEIIGLLYGVHSEEWLTELLQRTAFNQSAIVYLCTKDGDTFATSGKEKLKPFNIIEQYKLNGMISDEDYEGLKEAFAQGKDFLFKRKTAGGKLEPVYAKMDERNVWMMIQTFPHSLNEQMSRRYNRQILRMEITCAALFALYILFLMLSELAKRRKLEELNKRQIHKGVADLADVVSILADRYYKVLKLNLKSHSYETIKNISSEDIAVSGDSLAWLEDIAKRGFIFEDDIAGYIDFFHSKVYMERFNEGEEKVSHKYRRIINGEPRWVQMDLIKSSEYTNENPVAILYVFDIDDEVKTELALRESFDSATKANQAKTQFLSNMSHDIRTPMNAIIGMTAIAGFHLDDKERIKDCLAKITVASKHLLGLINEVLDMSKIESGRVDLNREEFNLSGLIDNLLLMSRPQIRAKGHELSVSIHDIMHENVIGDSQRIQQVFMNMMSNAIKYTPDGGKIGLSITEKATNKPNVGCYEFVFEDNGIGMSAEYLDHLFEPFVRAENDVRVRNTQGTGLGMTISRTIVQMMNGDIKVESELDKGSRFTVTIFLELPAAGADEASGDFADLPVLVVDDDQSVCESTCMALNSLGMKAQWLLSGAEALALVEERHGAGEDFFAIIIDWKMPGMDGIETTRAIRSAVGDGVPIIIISSYDWTDIESEARAAGANEFITKPLFKSHLTALFHKLTGSAADSYASQLLDFQEKDFSGRRILLVEDNEINAEITTEILETAKLEVELCRNGKEAVDRIIAVPDGYYDLIFMDVQMPVMNGYEATQAIRALGREYTSRVPIIAMTANTFSDDIIAAKNAGMNEHIGKPLSLELLLKTLKRWVGGR